MSATLQAAPSDEPHDEPVDDRPSIEFGGQTIHVRATVPFIVLARYASTPEPTLGDVYRNTYQLLQDVIDPADWPLFYQAAIDAAATGEELRELAVDIATSRPTRRPSGSPDGPSPTAESSTDDSSSPTPPGWSPTWGEQPPDLRSVEDMVQGYSGSSTPE